MSIQFRIIEMEVVFVMCCQNDDGTFDETFEFLDLEMTEEGFIGFIQFCSLVGFGSDRINS